MNNDDIIIIHENAHRDAVTMILIIMAMMTMTFNLISLFFSSFVLSYFFSPGCNAFPEFEQPRATLRADSAGLFVTGLFWSAIHHRLLLLSAGSAFLTRHSFIDLLAH